MATIFIDAGAYLDEVGNMALTDEVRRRIAQNRINITDLMAIGNPEPWTPAGLADDLRNAFYCRNASRFEMLLQVLSPKERAA